MRCGLRTHRDPTVPLDDKQEFPQNSGAFVANPFAFSVLLFAKSGIARFGLTAPETSLPEFGSPAWKGPDGGKNGETPDDKHIKRPNAVPYWNWHLPPRRAVACFSARRAARP